MEHIISLPAQYGLLLVFANVLLAQAGLPLPALPTLIVAGALVRDGQLSLVMVLLAAVVASLLGDLPKLQLTIVIGQYAQAYHLAATKQSVTDAVRAWKSYWPAQIPLPHPSPRNQMWVKKNPWFTMDVLPALRKRVRALI